MADNPSLLIQGPTVLGRSEEKRNTPIGGLWATIEG
jgi:hypothetical protein